MRFNVEKDLSNLDEPQPTVVFTKLFFKKYKKDGLIEFAEWCYRNDIDVCINSGEVDGYDLFNFQKDINFHDKKIKAVICYTIDIHRVNKGYQFSGWDNLMKQDIKSGYLVSNVVYEGDKN